jgi:hypothetical protein
LEFIQEKERYEVEIGTVEKFPVVLEQIEEQTSSLYNDQMGGRL